MGFNWTAPVNTVHWLTSTLISRDLLFPTFDFLVFEIHWVVCVFSTSATTVLFVEFGLWVFHADRIFYWMLYPMPRRTQWSTWCHHPHRHVWPQQVLQTIDTYHQTRLFPFSFAFLTMSTNCWTEDSQVSSFDLWWKKNLFGSITL